MGAEEEGLWGPKYLMSIEEDIDNIEYNINLDMVGVGDRIGVFKAYQESDDTLLNVAKVILDRMDIGYETGNSPNSDHSSFDDVGIKSVMFHYMDDPNYHTKEDTYKNLVISNRKYKNLQNTFDIVIKVINKVNCNTYRCRRNYRKHSLLYEMNSNI